MTACGNSRSVVARGPGEGRVGVDVGSGGQGWVGWEGGVSTRRKPRSVLGRDVPCANRVSVSVCTEIRSVVWETWLWGKPAGGYVRSGSLFHSCSQIYTYPSVCLSFGEPASAPRRRRRSSFCMCSHGAVRTGGLRLSLWSQPGRLVPRAPPSSRTCSVSATEPIPYFPKGDISGLWGDRNAWFCSPGRYPRPLDSVSTGVHVVTYFSRI